MIWRLMASVLAMSDAGAISLTSDKSDWPSQQQCNQILQDFYTPPPPTVVNGKKITIKISATCVPVGGPDGLLPPPVAEVVRPPSSHLSGCHHRWRDYYHHPWRDCCHRSPCLTTIGEEYDVMRPAPRFAVVPRFMPNGSPMLAPPCGGRLPCDY